MRVILAAAAALAVLTVSGCDINTGPPKTAKVECNCAAPTAPAGMRPGIVYAPPETPYHTRAHRHPHGYGIARWSGHSHYWRREYSEISVPTYDYHSDSHSYTMEGGGGSSEVSAYAYAATGGYAGGGAYVGGAVQGGDGYHVVDHGWVDGYGRSHDGGATAGSPVHYETHGGSGGRGDVWHGYDVDCPDGARHY